MFENRVDPFGTLRATPERGLVYGNRGCLHDGEGRIRRAEADRRRRGSASKTQLRSTALSVVVATVGQVSGLLGD